MRQPKKDSRFLIYTPKNIYDKKKKKRFFNANLLEKYPKMHSEYGNYSPAARVSPPSLGLGKKIWLDFLLHVSHL